MKLKMLLPSIGTIETRIGAPVAPNRIRGRELGRIRRRILERDGYECRKCGRVTTELEVDHITPLHLGGVESDENRQVLCVECHKKKSDEEEKGRG